MESSEIAFEAMGLRPLLGANFAAMAFAAGGHMEGTASFLTPLSGGTGARRARRGARESRSNCGGGIESPKKSTFPTPPRTCTSPGGPPTRIDFFHI